MKNFVEGNFSGGIGGGVNPENFKAVDNVEKTKDAYTSEYKKINLDLATRSAKIVKKQGLELKSLEKGRGFAA